MSLIKKIWRITGFLLLLFLVTNNVFASHIVGGEMTYRCLGGNSYLITLSIYEDCITGNPEAIAGDVPAYIGFFDEGTKQKIRGDDTMSLDLRALVPPNFKNDCVNNPPNVCLLKSTFSKVYTFPNNPNGIRIIYQRCCRNATISNIVNPGNIGATYSCLIPTSRCNNSAIFKNYPPQIICVNNPLVYDHSATDPDGDSLSYAFCPAYTGGSPQTSSGPAPIYYPNPGDSVQYASFYNSQRPMVGFPPIKIDPVTGIITGKPTVQGRFVVTVCCYEWRNGVVINTVTREFQFVVTNCSKAVVADIPQYSTEFNTYIVECDSFKVHFVNNSTTTQGTKYFWDFGVPGINADTSLDFEPDFVYPDTGVYTVKLIVNKGSTCSDSISRFVKVYPTFKANFSFAGNLCPNTPVFFTDLSTATYKPIDGWFWTFGDTVGSSTEQNPTYTYAKGGTYNVKLVATTIKGCVDTAVRQLDVENFHPSSGTGDTIIVKGESINFEASGGSQYTWMPSTFLNNPNIGNPIGYYPDTGRITYVVHVKSDAGCEGNDTFSVWVVGQPSFYVPSAFTPNGDGLNDILIPIGIGYRNVNYFRIYNRWGQEVFYGTKFKLGWDGTFNGVPQDLGVYFWVLGMTDRFGAQQVYKGDVTLIR
ncbi:PKD domain-containing protein [Taibaiella soli]|uniref:PKD domain-containing protein n=1 Tax=Taibaiella soli TaxID=1649169 RepID=A0A2W2AP76_9BACT|nr:PKD domain-containing protein [Taibaiella soli]PZF74180.1 hypothetical protein DN068_03960 [Taibaiella soli]